MKSKVLLISMNALRAGHIMSIAARLGIEAVVVSAQDEGKTLGELFSGRGPAHPGAAGGGGRPGEEMLVMGGLEDPLMDRFLLAMRTERCSPSLKAVLTPVNALWTPAVLWRHLSEERRFVMEQRAAAGKSVQS